MSSTAMAKPIPAGPVTSPEPDPLVAAECSRSGWVSRLARRSGTWARSAVARFSLRASGEEGMSTAEYAVGTIAAVAFAAVLYKVVTSPAVLSALTAIIGRALKAPF